MGTGRIGRRFIMTEFLNMGGYALYVWPSYGLGFLVLALNLFFARRQSKQAKTKAILHIRRQR